MCVRVVEYYSMCVRGRVLSHVGESVEITAMCVRV